MPRIAQSHSTTNGRHHLNGHAPTNRITPHLTPALRVTGDDLDNLHESGLDEDTIRENGLYTASGVELAELLKLHHTAQVCEGALVFPYRGLDGELDGFHRVRPHRPRKGKDGKPIKYEQKKGTPVRAYIPADTVHALAGSAPVWITEGEKKALKLTQEGFAAIGLGGIWCGTQTDGGAYTLIPDLASIDWSRRIVYVVFDYDDKPEARQQSALARTRLAKCLREAGAGEVYDIQLPPGPGGAKQGADDFLANLGDDGVAALRELAENADPVEGFSKAPAKPKRDEGGITLIQLIPPTLGEEAYHGLIGQFLRDVAPFTEATDAGVLAHLLPAVGTLIGPGPYIFAGGTHRARTFTALVGHTSTGRKGTSLVPVDLLMRKADPKFWAGRKVGGLSTGEGLIAAVADTVTRTKNEDGETVTDVEETDKRLYVVEEELSKIFAQGKRDGNILNQVIREAFDSGDLGILTRGSPIKASGAHIAVTGHITPEELRHRMPTVDQANGFGNRFLWFVVHSDKVLPRTEPIPDAVFPDKLRKRLQHVANANERVVRLTEEAQGIWDDVYPRRLRPDKPGLAGYMTARGSAHVLRVALVYAMMDEKVKGAAIHPVHLRAALAVWDYCEASAYLLFKTKTGLPLGDKLVELLTEHGPMQKQQFTDHVGRPANEIDEALAKLLAAGAVVKDKVKKGGAGRPAQVFALAGKN